MCEKLCKAEVDKSLKTRKVVDIDDDLYPCRCHACLHEEATLDIYETKHSDSPDQAKKTMLIRSLI